MGLWLHRWILVDFWDPVWPNLAASFLVFIFVYLKVRSAKKLSHAVQAAVDELRELHLQHHHEQMEAVARMTGTASPDTLREGGD